VERSVEVGPREGAVRLIPLRGNAGIPDRSWTTYHRQGALTPGVEMIATQERLRIVGHGSSTRLRLVGDWGGRPLDGIREARGVERALDKLLRDQVHQARAAGCSWTEVGDALGTSKQAAWERFSGEQ
jgi:hypothetical protein